MKRTNLLHLAFAAICILLGVTITGCEDEQSILTGNGELKLNVSVQPYNTDAETRVNLTDLTTLEYGDKIGVFLLDSEGNPYNNGVNDTNIPFTYTKSGWKPESPIKLTTANATLCAYYPYDSTQDNILKIDIKSGNTDYLYGGINNLNSNNTNVNLTLKHIMCYFNVKITTSGTIEKAYIYGDVLSDTCSINLYKSCLNNKITKNHIVAGEVIEYLNLNQYNYYSSYIIPVESGGEGSLCSLYVKTEDNMYASQNIMFHPFEGKLDIVNSIMYESFKDVPDGVYYVTRKGYPSLNYNSNVLGLGVVYGSDRIMLASTTYRADWGQRATDQVDIINYDTDSNNTYYNINKYDDLFTYPLELMDLCGDRNGIGNTKILKDILTSDAYASEVESIGTRMQEFYEENKNLGYNDWYVPTVGQLMVIYYYIDIIKGMYYKAYYHNLGNLEIISSNEKNYNYFWAVDTYNGRIVNRQKAYGGNLLLIRNLE